jgi:hypothetical protein
MAIIADRFGNVNSELGWLYVLADRQGNVNSELGWLLADRLGNVNRELGHGYHGYVQTG